MSVLVRIGARKAILRHGVWVSSDQTLEKQLNESTSRWISETGGPRIEARDQEGIVAQEMANRFGGLIHLKTKPKGDQSSRHFLGQRQMTLHFEGTLPLTKRKAAG
jgi:hypothetical protein